jgi:PAS domain S-box-containing protein
MDHHGEFEALRQSEERLRLALEAAEVGVWDWNILTGKITWTENLEIIHGLAHGAFEGTFDSYVKIIHPEDLSLFTEAIARAVEEGRDYQIEYRILWPDGSVHWIAGRGKVRRDETGRAVRMVGVGTDVTERKEMGRALASGERLFKILIENASDVISIYDRDLRFHYINLVVEKSLGIPRMSFIGKSNAELGLPPEPGPREEWMRALQQVFDTGEEMLHELVLERPEGKFYHQSRLTPSFASDGSVESVFSITRNVTDLVRAREAAQESESLLATTLRSIGDAVIATDAEGRITFLNPVAEALTGWTEAEAVGRPCREVFSIVNEQTHREVESPTERVMREGVIVGLANHTLLISREGVERPIDDSGAPIRDANGSLLGIVLVFRDVTERNHAEAAQKAAAAENALLYRAAQTEIEERKRIEEALREHQTQIEGLNARLRRAMSETHHRVKNNLQVMSALVDIQTLQYETDVPVHRLERLAQHIRGLAAIHDLLTQQAKSDAEVEFLSVQEALDKLLPTVRMMVEGRHIRLAAEDVRLPIQKGTSLAVLINEIVSNAVKHGAGDIDISFAVVQEHAELEILDEGPGFPENFDPEAAANTGLELIASLAQADLGGQVRFENRPEKGARVVICFPLS